MAELIEPERRLTVMLAEYDNLRKEIVERLRMQKEVERSQVLLLGILVAAVGWIWDQQAQILLLVASALFFIVGTIFFEQDINIALVASYLNRSLRRRIVECFAVMPQSSLALLEWESFREHEFLRTAISTVLTINRTLLTYLPGFATFAAYLYLKYWGAGVSRAWNEIEILLVFVNAILAIFLVMIGSKVPRLYKEIE